MSTRRFALQRGGPKRLELRWSPGWRDLKLSLDGRPLGTIATRRQLVEGEVFPLKDGSGLRIQLVSVAGLFHELHIERDGKPLPGSASDPLRRTNCASNLVFFIGGMNLVLALASELGLGQRPARAELGCLATAFLALGLLIRRGSLLAMGVASAAFAFDTLALLATQAPTPAELAGLLVRACLLVTLARGFKALHELRSSGLVESGATTGFEKLEAWSPAALAFVIAGLLLSEWGEAFVPDRAGSTPKTAAASDAQGVFRSVAGSVVVVEGIDGAGKVVMQGSGVVTGQATVVTNRHVATGAPRMRVHHGHRTFSARVRGIDPERDLAMLEVPGLGAPAVARRAAKSLSVGERVYAIGAPHGLELSLSEGLVSGLRVFEKESVPFVQTSAAISSGSSGGGLFDEKGRLVGITTFQFEEGQNLNFALPVEWLDDLPRRGIVPAGSEEGRRAGGAPGADAERLLKQVWNADRASAEATLQKMGDEASGFLLRALQHKDAEVRAHAAVAMGQLRPNDYDALIALLLATGDSDATVRLWATQAVQKYVKDYGEGAVAKLSKSREAKLRVAVAHALGESRSDAAADELIAMLTDQDAEVQQAAQDALVRYGPEGVPYLMRVLERPRGQRKEVLLGVMRTLGELGPLARDATPTLASARRSDDPELASAATQALLKMQGG